MYPSLSRKSVGGRIRTVSSGIVLPIALLAVVLSACASNGVGSRSGDRATQAKTSGKPLTSLTVGYTAAGHQFGPLFVAKELGLFKEYGLDVQLKRLKSSSQLASALASNSVQIGGGGGNAVARGILQGLSLRVISVRIPFNHLEMWGDPKLDSPADLEGKTISSTSPGSLGDAIWKEEIVPKFGINPDDVKVIYVGDLASLVSSVRSQSAAATMLVPPLGTQLRKYGKEMIYDTSEIRHAAYAGATTTEYAEGNGRVIRNFLKATTEATAILKTDRKRVLPILTEYSGVEGRKLNLYAYNYYKDLWSLSSGVDASLIRKSFKQEAGKVTGAEVPERVRKYIDGGPWERVKNSGFVEDIREEHDLQE